MRALLVVFSEPVSDDREDAYNDWYQNCHLPDVLSVPGYVRATRYRAFPGDRAFPQRYLALYELEVDDLAELRAVSDEHMRRIAANEMRRSPPDTIDRDTTRARYYVAAGPRQGDHDRVPEAVFLPFTDPSSSDQDRAFNDWYEEVHLPEVLDVPGFTAASRYRVTDIDMLGRPWVSPHEYLAVYELGSADPAAFDATMAELRRRIREGDRMEISAALGSEKQSQAFARVGERVERGEPLPS